MLLASSIPPAGASSLLHRCSTTFSGELVLVCCNASASTSRIFVLVQPPGLPVNLSNALFYNLPITSYDTLAVDLGIDLGKNEALWCYSDSGNVTFNLFDKGTKK
jgi:hypothetical protein